MFQHGVEYERFCEYEPELKLRRSNDWLPIAFIITAIFLPVTLVYQIS